MNPSSLEKMNLSRRKPLGNKKFISLRFSYKTPNASSKRPINTTNIWLKPLKVGLIN